MLTRTIENAQKKVEQQNFLIRKRVLEYDDVMNEQRRVVYKYRREILEGRDMSDVAHDELEEVVDRLVDEYTPGEIFEDWDLGGLETHAGGLWPLRRVAHRARPAELEPRGDQRDPDRGRARRLRPARGGVRRRADALPRAPDPAADHRQPLARAPLRDGLPARGHPPARVRPDRSAGRLQERGLHDVPRADGLDLGGVHAGDLPRRGQHRARPGASRCSARSERRAGEVQYSGGDGGRAALGARRGARRRRRGRGRGRGAAAAAAQPAGNGAADRSTRRRWSRPTRRRSAATIPAGAARARSTRSATGPDAPPSANVASPSVWAARRALHATPSTPRTSTRRRAASEGRDPEPARARSRAIEAVVAWATPSTDGTSTPAARARRDARGRRSTSR